jgi:hypothetical protein
MGPAVNLLLLSAPDFQRACQGSNVTTNPIDARMAAAIVKRIQRGLDSVSCRACLVWNCANARLESGYQSPGGARLATLRSTQSFSELCVWLSIPFHVLLSESLLGSAEQRSNRRFVDPKNFRDLLVTQPFASEDQQFRISSAHCGKYASNTLLILFAGQNLFG